MSVCKNCASGKYSDTTQATSESFASHVLLANTPPQRALHLSMLAFLAREERTPINLLLDRKRLQAMRAWDIISEWFVRMCCVQQGQIFK